MRDSRHVTVLARPGCRDENFTDMILCLTCTSLKHIQTNIEREVWMCSGCAQYSSQICTLMPVLWSRLGDTWIPGWRNASDDLCHDESIYVAFKLKSKCFHWTDTVTDVFLVPSSKFYKGHKRVFTSMRSMRSMRGGFIFRKTSSQLLST